MSSFREFNLILATISGNINPIAERIKAPDGVQPLSSSKGITVLRCIISIKIGDKIMIYDKYSR